MWSRVRALLMSDNEPGWGRSSGGPEQQNGSRPPSRPPQQRPPEGPPDLDELWRDLSRRINNLFGNRGGGGASPPPAPGGGGTGTGGPSARSLFSLIVVALVIAALLWLASGFFTVREGQVAAITRFGKFSHLTESAGIQWRMPWPVEQHEIVNSSRLQQVEVGYRGNLKSKLPKESLMLTGDQSIVDLQYAVQYRISDPQKFLYENNLSGSVDDLIRQASESAMREVVGRRTIDSVLYEEKAAVSDEAQRLTQGLLDWYQLGINVTDLTMQQAQPPEQVQDAFEDANKAAQDRQRMINEGQAYLNDVVPRADGAAERLRLQAQGYRDRLIAAAAGDADRFEKLLGEYRKAPDVTRERLYLEAMQQILSSNNKVLADTKSGNLMMLPLDKMMDASRDAQKDGKYAPSNQPSTAAEAAPAPPQVPAPAPTDARTGLRSRDRPSAR